MTKPKYTFYNFPITVLSLVDCEWDTWTIGECSATCGEGIRQNFRAKLLTEQFGGSCEGHANDIEPCNDGECPPRKKIY